MNGIDAKISNCLALNNTLYSRFLTVEDEFTRVLQNVDALLAQVRCCLPSNERQISDLENSISSLRNLLPSTSFLSAKKGVICKQVFNGMFVDSYYI